MYKHESINLKMSIYSYSVSNNSYCSYTRLSRWGKKEKTQNENE